MAVTPSEPLVDDDEPLGMRWTRPVIIGAVALVAMAVFWAVIFGGFLKKTNPDYLDDRAWVERADRRCGQLLDELDRLPQASEASSAQDRAAVLERATPLVARMVDDLERTAPQGADDQASLRGWFADWHTYLNDREQFAERLRRDPDARFEVTENQELHDGVDTTIEIFATVNDMPNCNTPGDVG